MLLPGNPQRNDAGAQCRLRVIVGDGNVLATVTQPLSGDAARLRVKLNAKQRKAAKKVKTVKFALDLIDADGNVISTTRSSLVRPLG